eukprot:15441251-Alexandrium_andersonii.AAC.1
MNSGTECTPSRASGTMLRAYLRPRSSIIERLERCEYLQDSARPAACGIDSLGSIRYSVRS